MNWHCQHCGLNWAGQCDGLASPAASRDDRPDCWSQPPTTPTDPDLAALCGESPPALPAARLPDGQGRQAPAGQPMPGGTGRPSQPTGFPPPEGRRPVSPDIGGLGQASGINE